MKIIVRKGFGAAPLDINTLSVEDVDRLTSNTQTISENIQIEFEIEVEIKKYGECLGVVFIEDEQDLVGDSFYKIRSKNLSLEEESFLIKELSLPSPETQKIKDLQNIPKFPFIVKNPESRRGREVYLIENIETFNKLKNFLNSKGVIVPSLGGHVSYDPSFEYEKFICQKYIKSPTKYFTTYRITVGCTGEVFSKCLTYSGNTKDGGVILETSPKKLINNRDLLTIIDSPFFLMSPKVVSNKSTGGGGIVLEPIDGSKKPTQEEIEILIEQGLNQNFPKAPEVVISKSVQIAKYLGKNKQGLIFGIDWIQSEDGSIYYLETNINPAGKPFLYTHYNGTGTHKDAMVEMFKKIFDSVNK